MSATNAHVTYGELLDTAHAHAAEAIRALQTDRSMPNKQAVRDVLVLRDAVLGIAGRAARQVLGPVRVDGLRLHVERNRSADQSEHTPTIRSVLSWMDALDRHRSHGTGITTDRFDEDEHERVGAQAAVSHLRATARHLGAAGDLVQTHRASTGSLRLIGDPRVAVPELHAITGIIRVSALVADPVPFAMTARAADLDKIATRYLMNSGRAMQSAWQLSRSPAFATQALTDLSLAAPAVRTTSPMAEWEDRLHRVRQRLQAHTRLESLSVHTAGDIARLAMTTTRFLYEQRHHAQTPDATPTDTERDALTSVLDGWQVLLREMHGLRSEYPADRLIRGECARLIGLLIDTEPEQRPALAHAVEVSLPTLGAITRSTQTQLAWSPDVWTAPRSPRRTHLARIEHAAQRAQRVPGLLSWPTVPASRSLSLAG